MKCIIVGIKPQDYTNKNGKQVKGMQLYMLADNADVFGKVPKDCFISQDSPLYLKNAAVFADLGELEGREVNVEWDVETYGTKQVKKLVSFDFTEKFIDFVERPAKAVKNA
nr:MAG TPA: hypothetical protein [Inoviridae sp.]